MTTIELSQTEDFRAMSRLVMGADCVFVPLVIGRGVDSHGHPIRGLGEMTLKALKDVAQAGRIAETLLTNYYGCGLPPATDTPNPS